MFACICVYVCACVNMRICVALGCRTKSRKKACECPTAYEHTTHTFYPHVLDPYICILLPFLLLCCSFHFSPLLSHLHPCTNTHTYYLSPTHAHMPKKKLVTQGQSLSLLPIDSSRGYIVICYQPISNKMEQREHTPSHTNS